jgi:ankyrin repeat protein
LTDLQKNFLVSIHVQVACIASLTGHRYLGEAYSMMTYQENGIALFVKRRPTSLLDLPNELLIDIVDLLVYNASAPNREYRRMLLVNRRFYDICYPSLLRIAPDVRLHSYDGLSVLHWASARGYVNLAEKLLAAGADVNGFHSVWTRNRNATPLSLASKCGRVAIVELLLNHGALVHVEEWDAIVELTIGHVKKCCHGSALVYAAQRRCAAIIRLLLEHNATLNFRGRSMSLYQAARFGHLSVVDWYLGEGMDVNSRHPDNRQTPLHFAASRCQAAVVERLLRRGANPYAKDVNGWTPLDVLVNHCRIPCNNPSLLREEKRCIFALGCFSWGRILWRWRQFCRILQRKS